MDPEVLDVTTATPRPAMEPCQPFPRGAFYPEGEVFPIVISCLFDAVGIQLVFQKRAVVERGMCLDLNRLGVHHGLLYADA